MQYFNSALKGSDLKVRLLNLNVSSVINAEGKPTNSSAILSTALQYSIAWFAQRQRNNGRLDMYLKA